MHLAPAEVDGRLAKPLRLVNTTFCRQQRGRLERDLEQRTAGREIAGMFAGIVFGERESPFRDLQTFVGTAVILLGVGLVNSRYGRRRLFGREPAGVLTP